MCDSKSVCFIEFLMNFCYDITCAKLLLGKTVMEEQKLGQILHVDKTCFLRPGHI